MSAPSPPGDDLSRSAAGDRNPWLVAVVISIATFMQVLDTSIANVALRYIAGSLAAGIDESTWVLTSYLVASAVILPISGWLAGVIGRKRFYMLCVAVFTVASLLCAVAPNLTALIVFRILQGVGGGGMAPSEQAMLADMFPARDRGKAFALYGVAVIVAPTVGPTFGGWLTDNYSWHWIFLINGPIGLLSLALVQWIVTEPEALERERREHLAGGLRVDWIGFVLVALWLGCLEIVLDKGEREDWFSSNFINFFASVSALSFLAFVPWELSRDDPIVDIRLFAHRRFATACVMMLATGAILFGTTQLLPQLLQQLYSYTAVLSGLAMMPGGIAMIVAMMIAGQLSAYVPPRYMIAGGMLAIALAMWHFTSLTPDASFGFFARSRILQTIGLPFIFVTITAVSYVGLPPDKTGQASSLINVARNLGGSIGISLSGTLLARGTQMHQNYLVDHLVPSSPQYQSALENAAALLAGRGVTGSAQGLPVVIPGVPEPGAASAAFAVIAQTVQQQAALLAYIDVFADYALLALVLAPVAMVLLRRGQAAPGH